MMSVMWRNFPLTEVVNNGRYFPFLSAFIIFVTGYLKKRRRRSVTLSTLNVFTTE